MKVSIKREKPKKKLRRNSGAEIKNSLQRFKSRFEQVEKVSANLKTGQ